MERYFVRLSNHEAIFVDTSREAVEHAYDSETPLLVNGERESVPVSLILEVSRYTRDRRGLRKIMRFSGVVTPTEMPFVGQFEESEAERYPLIQVVVDPGNKGRPKQK